MSHFTNIKVRGYHLDVYQHVNNARYLEFLEDARWEYLEETGDVAYMEKLGYAWVLVNININYRHSALLGQTLAIETYLSKIGGKSATFRQVITVAGTQQLIADADVTFVCLDKKSAKAVAIEGELREKFEQHLSRSPEIK